jgi:hypothetical protein
MTGKTKIFWLLSDHKTVREIDIETVRKEVLIAKERHLIYVHGDSEFYTTKKWVYFAQFNQCIAHLKKEKP